MALMKSGWLWRQSSILRRWKKHWFDLWIDGGLVYYQDENRQNMEERILLKYNTRDVKAGRACGDVHPPEGSNQESLLSVEMRDHSKVLLCAESEDDALAWKMALLEVESNPVSNHFCTATTCLHSRVAMSPSLHYLC
ncbi:hypothetical protein FKM82_009903 [Ascaphus truei]